MAGAANQDAWRFARSPHGVGVVVADGVGSAIQARRGARFACISALAVFSRLRGSESVGNMAGLISEDWHRRLGQGRPGHHATTLLFAFRFRTGRLLVGGVGDGLAAVLHPDLPGRCRVIERPGGEFGETYSLSSAGGIAHWCIEEFCDESGCHAVILATDGVANDLIVSRLYDLGQWLRGEYENVSSRRWRTGLRDILNDWPTPGSVDDRSLALLWHSGGNAA
jgi:hypothetical protein